MQRNWKDGRVMPGYSYGGRSIVDVPNSLLYLFDSYDKIVLIVVDGLGFDTFVKYADVYPFFGLLRQQAVCQRITTNCPSTTSAVMTTLATGLTPQEHGVGEWVMYEPSLEAAVQFLPFTRVGSDASLEAEFGYEPSRIFDGLTIFEKLNVIGIPAYALNRYAGSAYSNMTHRGCRRVEPFTRLTNLGTKLAQLINLPRRTFCYAYLEDIDKVQHAYGKHTPEHEKVLEEFSKVMMRVITHINLPKKVMQKTLLMLVADHGHIPVESQNIVYINDCPELVDLLAHSSNGETIPLTGSSRHGYVHTTDKNESTFVALAQSILGDKADVIPVREALSAKLLGINTPSAKYLSRIGNILILPRDYYHVWWKFHPQDLLHKRFRAAHGGLSAEEMLIPFVQANLALLCE